MDQIINYVTAPEFSDEVYKAREQYNSVVGEVYEDDQSYEERMSHFLEWYTFDRNFTGKTISPLLDFVEKKRKHLPKESHQELMDLVKNIHGLFKIKKISRDYVVVYDFFTNRKHKVMEKESQLVFRKNDLFEGRIIPSSNSQCFTGVYCFHPQKSEKFIKKEVKKLIDELKIQKNQLKKLIKEKLSKEAELLKVKNKQKKLEEKIKNISSDIKIERFKDKLESLDTVRIKLDSVITGITDSIFEIETIKIQIADQEAKNQLMHRLAHMSLKWERFRNIDIDNIYKN